MLAILPIIVFVLFLLLACRQQTGWRSAVLTASVIWAVMLTLMTESVSAVHQLNIRWIAVGWTLVIVTVVMYGYRSRKQIRDWPRMPAGQFSHGQRFLLATVGLIMGTTGLIAVVAPPNTWDSMTYHMARVVNWMQYESVNHYPTHIMRQLHRPPWKTIRGGVPL